MDTSPDSQALPQGTQLHEFVIERVLGSGGFGITYLARDTSLNRQVVIKENLPSQFVWRETATGTVRPRHSSGGDSDDFEWSMKNFLREAETLATMDHSGIVRVLRKFEANGTAYFVMPFVQGVAFDQLITQRQEKNQPFTEEELRGLLERMLDALGYLHDRGIYHRDIKPANLLITMDGIPTLIDFGSARQRLSERSMTVIESAGYTPFEQLQSRGNVGPWSDLYALGATLSKAITGETPPKAADRVMDDPWPGLSSNTRISGQYSSAFLSSIERALTPSPSHRWQDARQWQHYLQTGMPIAGTAERPLPPQPVSKTVGWPETTSQSSDLAANTNTNSIAPALWSPNIAGILSLILLPVFGIFLHARNARALGLPNEEKRNMWWFYGMIAYFAISILFAGLGGLLKFYLPVLLVWYFTCGRNQEKLVKERYGDDYPRKSFLKPIAVTTVSIFAFVIFLEGVRSLATEEADQSLAAEVASSETPNETVENLAISYFNRGVEHANGEGVPQDYNEAVKWYRKAAELGNLSAMNNLGAAYEDGNGVPKDMEESAKWYRKAAELGSSIAQRNLGYAYARGEGVQQNLETAIGWFRKSAMQGDATAQYMVGLGYTGVEGIPTDMSEAAKWFQKSADQGHSEAQDSLGDCYFNGNGVTENHVTAVIWFRKAAEKNLPSAQNSLGACYEYGVGGSKNLFEAAKWYRASADQGYADAQYNLARAYHYGNGVVKDTSQAFGWYQKAAGQGQTEAQYFVGVFYLSGEGVEKDTVKAVEWLSKSALSGDSDAQYQLGLMYGNGTEVPIDHAESAKWYRMAAEAGHTSAMANLGIYYTNGTGVPKDEAEAVKWWRMAAEAGDAHGMKNFGWCYEYGKGVAKDEAEAVKWYRKALDSGDQQAAEWAAESLKRLGK